MTLKKTSISLATALSLMLASAEASAETYNRTQMATFLVQKAQSMPDSWHDKNDRDQETPEARDARVRMIGEVVAEQAPIAKAQYDWFWSVDDLALATLTKIYYESGRFSLRVHQGLKRGDHGHSVCLGQIWGGKTRGPEKIVGTDRESTARCINEVMRHLSKHQNRCLNPSNPINTWTVAIVYAGYGTGHSCSATASMPVKDEHGQPVIDPKTGKQKRDPWAQNRARTWSSLRKEWSQERDAKLANR